jgi:hypothetical protein
MDHFDERDKLEAEIQLKSEKKRDLHSQLVEAAIIEKLYDDPDNKKNLQFDHGQEFPTRLVYDFYHNYKNLTMGMLDELAATDLNEQEWRNIVSLPTVKSMVDCIVTPIRDKQRYSRPTITVKPCKQKKLQRTVPKCGDQGLSNDVKVYAKLQSDIALACARLKQLDQAPGWAKRAQRAKQKMQEIGLHSQSYFETVTDEQGNAVDEVEYAVCLNETTRPKKLSAKKLKAIVERLLMDKTAITGFDVFRARLMQAIEEDVEYSQKSSLKFMLKIPEEEEEEEGADAGSGGEESE